MGTRALWQNTSQTSAHGSTHTGRGSARRVREFRISSDTFGALGSGEAVIYTPIAREPTRGRVLATDLDWERPLRINQAGSRHACETQVDPSSAIGPGACSESNADDAETGPAFRL